MRWIWNGLIVIVGVPLLGQTFLLIACFTPQISNHFAWPAHIYIFAGWLLNLWLFVQLYTRRTQWLERTGLFKSWADFKAYMTENHGCPEVSVQEKEEFLSWSNLSEERPQGFRQDVEGVYRKINSEIEEEARKNRYIRCLAWYAGGWPVQDDRADLSADQEQA